MYLNRSVSFFIFIFKIFLYFMYLTVLYRHAAFPSPWHFQSPISSGSSPPSFVVPSPSRPATPCSVGFRAGVYPRFVRQQSAFKKVEFENEFNMWGIAGQTSKISHPVSFTALDLRLHIVTILRQHVRFCLPLVQFFPMVLAQLIQSQRLCHKPLQRDRQEN